MVVFTAEQQVFPADAGMNRRRNQPDSGTGRVPRGRGDEPGHTQAWSNALVCSPRTRG